MKTKILLMLFVAVMVCGCSNSIPQKKDNLPNMKSRCEQAMLAICSEIAKLKPRFPELANFGPQNTVVPGNVVPRTKQLTGLRLDYYHNFKHIQGPDKTQSYYKADDGGCILNVQLFPEGGSWEGFRSGVRTLDILCEPTGVRVQASIDCPNEQLANRLEKIIRKKVETLK